jgi:hypothetical protein
MKTNDIANIKMNKQTKNQWRLQVLESTEQSSGDCLIANRTPHTRTTTVHSFLHSAYQLKLSWLAKDDNYVLERASKMSCASGVTPTPILSASASACLTWANHENLSESVNRSVISKPRSNWDPSSRSTSIATILDSFTAQNLTTTKHHCWEQISLFAEISSKPWEWNLLTSTAIHTPATLTRNHNIHVRLGTCLESTYWLFPGPKTN